MKQFNYHVHMLLAGVRYTRGVKALNQTEAAEKGIFELCKSENVAPGAVIVDQIVNKGEVLAD